MCNEEVHENPWCLEYVPDHLKTRSMCNETVDWRLYLLQHVPDWFVPQQVKSCHNDRLIEWYEGYKKWRDQKSKIKEELLANAWHPSRYWDWCMSKDEKQGTEKLWV